MKTLKKKTGKEDMTRTTITLQNSHGALKWLKLYKSIIVRESYIGGDLKLVTNYLTEMDTKNHSPSKLKENLGRRRSIVLK